MSQLADCRTQDNERLASQDDPPYLSLLQQKVGLRLLCFARLPRKLEGEIKPGASENGVPKMSGTWVFGFWCSVC